MVNFPTQILDSDLIVLLNLFLTSDASICSTMALQSASNVKFRQASNHCKSVIIIIAKAPKLAYANKTKESITSQKLGSCDFWRIVNSALSKGK